MIKTVEGVKALIQNDDRYLVLFEPNGNPDLPGGRLEHRETLQSGLHREILEETGLTVKILDPLIQWSFLKSPLLQVSGVTYNCLFLGGDPGAATARW